MENTNEDILVFNKIKNENIFVGDFLNLCNNNSLEFSNKSSIAIIYAPNGVGKTSLANALKGAEKTQLKIKYGSKIIDSKNCGKFIHVIADQNNRDIIQGETNEFILGENIQLEYELKKTIDSLANSLWSKCQQILERYSIDKKSSLLVSYFRPTHKSSIEKLASRHGVPNSIEDIKTAIKPFQSPISDKSAQKICLSEDDQAAFIKDINEKQSSLNTFIQLRLDSRKAINEVHKIEEDNDAIKVLEKYKSKKECIVCDNAIEQTKLLKKKKTNMNNILNKIPKEERKTVRELLSCPYNKEPIDIVKAITNFYEGTDVDAINKLKQTIEDYIDQLTDSCIKELETVIEKSELTNKIAEFETLTDKAPSLEEEDEIYIKEVIAENMGKDVKVQRNDSNKKIYITLDGVEFLGKGRNELHLSAGEQNFLSLSFEALRAKNSDAKFIVLDDPISSFDSIYKYKIVYTILKFLQNKKVILLTHNVDLIKLVEHQKNGCFQLYILNNYEGGNNGFIKINKEEVNLLVDLSKLIDFFRNNEITNLVKNPERFLISLVPFMRSYAKITNNKAYNELMPLMHSGKQSKVDINNCYNSLFSSQTADDNKFSEYKITFKDIIDLDAKNNLEIIDKSNYPLLNLALNNSIQYLRLRLLTEKEISERFSMNIKGKNLSQIILKAYRNDSVSRVKLMSKKSLLNDFNHFEGNLSIFQPAIDISQQQLQKEIKEIENFFEIDE